MTVLCEQGKTTDAADNSVGIYYWKNLINGKGYVGQTLRLRERLGQYIGMKFKTQRAFYAAVQKYGLENFTCYKLMDCCPSKVALNYWETFWIKELNTFIDGGNGYNLTCGGEGTSGYRHSEETRRKISEASSNMSQETRRKIGEASRGRKYSEEARRKISEAKRNMSQETRKKMSDARRGKKLSDLHRMNMRHSSLLRFGTLYKDFFIF